MKDDFLQIQVNGEFEFRIRKEDIHQLDVVADQPPRFHIIRDNKTYYAEVVRADYKTKTFSIRIEGNVYTVELRDEYDQLVNKMGLSAGPAGHKMDDVKAPMPGLVIDVEVEVGQEVTKGEGLLILEAMKMENIIKSSGVGKVKAIHVGKGEAVDKGQLLIEME